MGNERRKWTRWSIRHALIVFTLVAVVLTLYVREQRARLRDCMLVEPLERRGWRVIYRDPMPVFGLGRFPSVIWNYDSNISDSIAVSSEDVRVISQLKYAQKLILLPWEVEGASQGLRDHDLEQLATVDQLESLQLYSPHFTRAGVRHLTAMPSLTHIAVDGEDFKIRSLSELEGLSQ